MYPVAIGIAALAAWALSGCGGGNNKDLFGDHDASTDGSDDNRVRNTGGRSGSGAAGATAGSAGVAGTGGAAGNSGSGGTAGMDAGVEASTEAGPEAGLDAGADVGIGDATGEASGDAFVSDAMDQEAVAYHFGMIYGSNPVVGLNGSGTLYFSKQNSCQLLGGSFQAQNQSGDTFAMSVDLSGMQSLDVCGAEVTLPLAGGVFEGMTWMLGNKSSVVSPRDSFEILACGLQGDGGTGLENCSGALNISNP